MELLQYCVKAFTSDPLQGNPAAIVLLDSLLSKKTMQRIAFINGFPETVFLFERAKQTGHYEIWWFTPRREVVNAGHATLAAQYVLTTFFHCDTPSITLRWGGEKASAASSLTVKRNEANTLVFGPAPLLKYSARVAEMFGAKSAYTVGRDIVLELEAEEDVCSFDAPLAKLSSLPFRGLCITAPSNEHDYCSRFFAPTHGVPEDYVTASAHHYLAGHWSERLRKSTLKAIQCSPSPGTIDILTKPYGIELKGPCCLFSISHLQL